MVLATVILEIRSKSLQWRFKTEVIVPKLFTLRECINLVKPI